MGNLLSEVPRLDKLTTSNVFKLRPTFAILINGRNTRHSSCRVRDAPIDWRRSSFAFPSKNGSIDILTTKDQIDVGLSDPLQVGLGLFDPLHAVSPGPALRSACLGTAKAGILDGFSMFRINHGTG
jgi:hypothetical protein